MDSLAVCKAHPGVLNSVKLIRDIMAIFVRFSEVEVQAGSFIYTFEVPDEADAFETCIIAR